MTGFQALRRERRVLAVVFHPSTATNMGAVNPLPGRSFSTLSRARRSRRVLLLFVFNFFFFIATYQRNGCVWSCEKPESEQMRIRAR